MNDVDAFLEHHGVKGQKWGIKNVRSGAKYQSPSSKHKNETPEERQKRKQRNTYLAISAARLAIVAYALHHILKDNGNKKASLLKPKNNKSFRIDRDGRTVWNLDVKHDPNIIRMQERQRNGAFQIKQYLKRQGHDVVEGSKSGGKRLDAFLAYPTKRYLKKLSKRTKPPVSQNVAFAIRRQLNLPTPTKKQANKQFSEEAKFLKSHFKEA